jgi:hypothetical protein
MHCSKRHGYSLTSSAWACSIGGTVRPRSGATVGAKPPLRPKHVWSIRTHLMIERRTRDLAMFNLAIDSKLRGCDVVALKVGDIAPGGYSTRCGPYKAMTPPPAIRIEPAFNTRRRGAARASFFIVHPGSENEFPPRLCDGFRRRIMALEQAANLVGRHGFAE